jgi:F0F1-type ATP synthase assembly protein I
MGVSNDKNWWKPGIVIFVKVSASVAIPIVLALFIGKYLDTKYNTTPWIFLGLTAIAFIISLVTIYRSLTDYMKKLEQEEKEQREDAK